MKNLYINQLQKDLLCENEPFLIVEAAQLEDKNKRPYYNLTIADKTGKVAAKIWSDALMSINTSLLQPGKVVKVSGKIDEFKGNLQINIMNVSDSDEDDMDDFVETSEYDADEMMDELNVYIEGVKNAKIKQALKAIFKDEEIGKRFKIWPAGNSIHHGFKSGLLQHVLEMLSIATGMRKFYSNLNFDVLVAGIILHDIGKIKELSGGVASNYTKEGSLLGHIVIGAMLFTEKAKDILDEDTYLHITHLILSHHGILEYGSPIVPATPEAIALYYIDGISSKTRGAVKTISEMMDNEEFSKPNRFLEGARFWKNHSALSEDVIEDIVEAIDDELEEDDGDQIPLV